MVDLLRQIRAALRLDGRAAEGPPADQLAEHRAVLDKLAEQRARLAALDAGMPRRSPEWRGFRL